MKLPGNMQQMMRQAQQMQDKLQQEIALIKVEATAGGGMVSVTLKNVGELTRLVIDDSLLAPGEGEILVDLIIAAHAAQTGRTILSRDAKARFGELPGVSAIDA